MKTVIDKYGNTLGGVGSAMAISRNGNVKAISRGSIATYQCGEPIEFAKAVVMKPDGKIYTFDVFDESHYGAFAGIARQGAGANGYVGVFVGGVAAVAGSGWQEGKLYYIADGGSLSEDFPDPPGIVKLIAVGVGPDQVYISPVLETISS